MIDVKDVSMQFRLSGDRVMSLKEFVTAKIGGENLPIMSFGL